MKTFYKKFVFQQFEAAIKLDNGNEIWPVKVLQQQFPKVTIHGPGITGKIEWLNKNIVYVFLI